jgi:hypothetical protein
MPERIAMFTYPTVEARPAPTPSGTPADACVRAPAQQQRGTQAAKTPVPVYRPRTHTQTPDSWATISAPS